MIQEKINKLIPFISENFISYPLWEEGNYIPVVSFWAVVSPDLESEFIENEWEFEFIEAKGYELTCVDSNFVGVSRLCVFNMTPLWDYCEDGSDEVFKVQKENWSIEEMLDIISEFLIENKLSHE